MRRMLDEGALVVVTLTLRGGDGQPPAERFRELAEKVSVLGFQQLAIEEQYKNIHVRFFRFGQLKRQGHDDEAAADLERRFTNA